LRVCQFRHFGTGQDDFAHEPLTPAGTTFSGATFPTQREEMMTNRLVLALVFCAFGIAPALAVQPVPYLPVPHDAAVILNTGSTNTLGYRIVIQRSGQAEYIRGTTRAVTHVDPALAQQFFVDMQRDRPFAEHSISNCMKPASFATSLYVWWRGQRTYDLSCPVAPTEVAVAADARRIAAALGLAQPIMIQLPTNEPRRPMPEPAPSASASM
jgi:hypothetical protein